MTCADSLTESYQLPSPSGKTDFGHGGCATLATDTETHCVSSVWTCRVSVGAANCPVEASRQHLWPRIQAVVIPATGTSGHVALFMRRAVKIPTLAERPISQGERVDALARSAPHVDQNVTRWVISDHDVTEMDVGMNHLPRVYCGQGRVHICLELLNVFRSHRGDVNWKVSQHQGTRSRLVKDLCQGRPSR